MTKLEQALVEARLTGHALSSLQGELRTFREGKPISVERTREDSYTRTRFPRKPEDQAEELASQSERNRKNVDGIRFAIEAMSKEREQLRRARGWMT